MTTETTPETTVSAVAPPAAKMPPKVAAAVVQVARGIKAVAKNGVNEHGKYMFASVDDFYDAVGPVMADAGLFTFADMTGAENYDVEAVDYHGKVKRTGYLKVAFDICLVHESGEMSAPVNREVSVVAAGPQAYASAESFITKYFIRNLFKVPTGDYDADNDAKSETRTPQPPEKPPATKRPEIQQRKAAEPASEPAKPDADAAQNIKTDPENRVDPEQPPAAEGESKSAKLKPVLEFVATVNTFLDTKPDAAALFTYEGQPGVNARMKRIRSDEFAHVPAVADLVKRLNAIYATAQDADREVGQDG